MVRAIDHFSTVLGVIGLILMMIVIGGAEDLGLVIAAGVVALTGFSWSRWLNDDPVTSRGFALAILYFVLLIVFAMKALIREG